MGAAIELELEKCRVLSGLRARMINTDDKKLLRNLSAVYVFNQNYYEGAIRIVHEFLENKKGG